MEYIQVQIDKLSNQYHNLFSIIEESGALKNPFFERCRRNELSEDELRTYLINWFQITKTFAINTLNYSAMVARKLQLKQFTISRERIEAFLLGVIEIAAVEFESTTKDRNNFHYKAFARLAPKLGIDVTKLDNDDYPLLSETLRLALNIVEYFDDEDVISGFAILFVVETIAYNIVESMNNSFAQAKDPYGNMLYNINETWYISKHLILELEHSDEVSSMLKILNLNESQFETMKIKVAKVSNSFNNFWNALNEKKN